MTPIEFIDANGDRLRIRPHRDESSYVVIEKWNQDSWEQVFIPKSSLPDLKRAIEKFEEQK